MSAHYQTPPPLSETGQPELVNMARIQEIVDAKPAASASNLRTALDRLHNLPPAPLPVFGTPASTTGLQMERGTYK